MLRIQQIQILNINICKDKNCFQAWLLPPPPPHKWFIETLPEILCLFSTFRSASVVLWGTLWSIANWARSCHMSWTPSWFLISSSSSLSSSSSSSSKSGYSCPRLSLSLSWSSSSSELSDLFAISWLISLSLSPLLSLSLSWSLSTLVLSAIAWLISPSLSLLLSLSLSWSSVLSAIAWELSKEMSRFSSYLKFCSGLLSSCSSKPETNQMWVKLKWFV
jgi:hypothetical protein